MYLTNKEIKQTLLLLLLLLCTGKYKNVFVNKRAYSLLLGITNSISRISASENRVAMSKKQSLSLDHYFVYCCLSSCFV